MTVIGMTIEIGSRGTEVAAGVAARLGLKIVRSQVVAANVAARLGVDANTVQCCMEGSASIFDRCWINRRKLAQFMGVEIRRLAQQGDILIEGWGAAALLCDVPQVISVRVCAPLEYRVRALMNRSGGGKAIDAEAVRTRIERHDATAAWTMRNFFQVEPDDARHHHLTLNTERLSVEDCVKAIAELVDNSRFNYAGAPPAPAVKFAGSKFRSANVVALAPAVMHRCGDPLAERDADRTNPAHFLKSPRFTGMMAKFMRGAIVGLAAMAISPPAQAGVPFTLLAAGNAPLAPVLKTTAAAVVTISTKLAAAPSAQKKPTRRTDTMAERFEAAGSGTVIDAAQGLIVTNQHVIDRAEKIAVTLANGREMPATLVGGDADTDIALIKVAAEDLTSVPLGNSDDVQVGDFVLAIGNPFGFQQTVSSGIVGGLHRDNVGIEVFEDFIQTDAALYPGNSGGGLINMRGELIGISTAFGGSNANAGMGFAIPINMARAIVDRILESGNLHHGTLGVGIYDATQAMVREYKLSLAAQTAPVVTRIGAGSAGERAGLKPGDVVMEIDGVPVRNTRDVHARMWFYCAGDTADFTVMRDGRRIVLHATIADAATEVVSRTDARKVVDARTVAGTRIR
jgi:serine protease DegQ